MYARFAELCRKSWLELTGIESIEKDVNLNFPKSTVCEEDIYLGFFFDGTNNNKYRDAPAFANSNVARHYEVYPGDSTPTPIDIFQKALCAWMAPLRGQHPIVINSRAVG